VLRLLLNNLPLGLARGSCSFLADDRRVPEGEREKNSTEPSRSYHATIMDVIYSGGDSTSELVQDVVVPD
jgi:hypothetical protein